MIKLVEALLRILPKHDVHAEMAARVARLSAILDRQRAETIARLEGGEEYRALKWAADLEAQYTPNRWFARNRLALLIEGQMPGIVETVAELRRGAR